MRVSGWVGLRPRQDLPTLGNTLGKICRPPATPSARSADCRQDLPQNRQFPPKVGKVGISRGEFLAERGKICRVRGKICRGVGKSSGELNPIRANSGEFTRIEAGHAADIADPASSCRVYPHSVLVNPLAMLGV
jgi:hypothetical protein